MIIRRWSSGGTSVRAFVLTNGSTTITANGNANTDGLIVGTAVTGTGIPANTTIATVVSSTQLTLSNAVAGLGTSPSAQTLTFTNIFIKEFPQTKAQLIRTNDDLTTIFDSNDKIKAAYLPNIVFDSLLFIDTLEGALQDEQLSSATLAEAASAIYNFLPAGRDPKGAYLISGGNNITLSQNAVTAAQGPYGTLWFKAIFSSGEERSVTPSGSVVIEPGDWIVVTRVAGGTGATSGTAIEISFAIVNNTYELMTGANGTTAGAPGLVPAPSGNQNLHFLRGDGTWVIPTNTTYSGSASITLNGTSFERAALTGDVTASANSNATTIANDAVTFAKMQNIATSTILGRNDAGTGDIEALTAAEVRTLINVADGATANTGTVTSVSGTGTVAGLSLSGTVTTSGNITLGGTLSTPVSTINDSTTVGQNLVKLSNPGAVRFLRVNADNSVSTLTDSDFRTAIGAGTSSTVGTVTSVATTGTVNGLTLTGGTITSSGTITLGGTLSGVANSALASMVQNTIKGRITASTGAPEDLTAANVRSIIELAAPIYIQTATPTPTVNNSLWYDIN